VRPTAFSAWVLSLCYLFLFLFRVDQLVGRQFVKRAGRLPGEASFFVCLVLSVLSFERKKNGGKVAFDYWTLRTGPDDSI
jgi:hypothetical protein